MLLWAGYSDVLFNPIQSIGLTTVTTIILKKATIIQEMFSP
jgi:hypothetical protein